MPELPEVETIRRGLAGTVVGRRIDAVIVTGERTVRRSSADSVVAGLEGRRLAGADRRGKYLLLPLDDGATLLIHLRMSGQLRLLSPGGQAAAHTHVRLLFEGGDELHFVDPRTFGEVVVVAAGDEAPDVARLGPDALAVSSAPPAQLAGVLGACSRRLKYLLTDQHRLAGLGNIYADEVLHRARLAPVRVSSSLDAADVRRLHRALGAVLGEAIEARGSSLGDAQYVDLWGEGGSYQAGHRVYGREGSAMSALWRPYPPRPVGRAVHVLVPGLPVLTVQQVLVGGRPAKRSAIHASTSGAETLRTPKWSTPW